MMRQVLCLVVVLGTFGAARVGAEPTPERGIAEVLGRTVSAAERDQLSDIIVSALMQDYTEKAGIVATDEEIAAFVAASRAHESDQRREWRERRDKLRKRLEATDLPAETREQMTRQVAMLDRFLETDKPSDTYLRENPDAIDSIDHDIAEQFVRAWKVNASLYKRYGGRVIFQQAGPEPLDAYRQFLEARKQAGDFRIMDAASEARFWNYFTNDTLHTFVTETPEGGAAMFATPWWLETGGGVTPR